MDNIWVLILITCASMVLKDFVTINMTIAEARGNIKIAAIMNPLGTIAQIAFFSYGAVQLLQHYHWLGVVALLPVLVVDTLDGYFFTKWGRKIETDEEKPVEYKRKRIYNK